MAKCVRLDPTAAATAPGTTGHRSRTMRLNGRELAMGEKDALPPLAPGSCAFLLL